MESLLTYDQAQALVVEHARPLPAEQVAVAAAAGRVAAEDVRATVDLPPFPSSAMDGFAVRAGDLPGPLRVVGESAAGAPFQSELGDGEAVAISTGGVVPEGSDAVAPIEIVSRSDNTIEVRAPLDAGANVRPRGGDVRADEVVLARGALVGPAHVAAAAASGVATFACARRPCVAVVATGSELVPPGQELASGQVYEANGSMLGAALASAGAEVVSVETVGDDLEALRAVLARGLEADALVTSGGVSVGEHDLVRAVEAELGVEEVFWRIAMRPGKPLAFGVRGETLVFGLPGNPVSALVGCELFVKPALRALQGLSDPLPVFEWGRLQLPLRRNRERDQFVRARARPTPDSPLLEPLVGQESHMIARTAAANALVRIPRGTGEVAAGEAVSWLRLY